MRSRLLLQVEDREPVEVAAFEPEIGISSVDGGRFFFMAPELRASMQVSAALTVEARAWEAAESARIKAEPPVDTDEDHRDEPEDADREPDDYPNDQEEPNP